MAEDQLDSFEREGADPFAALEKTPAESLPAKDTAEEAAPEEAVPFHKDARWIKREEELNQLRERDEVNARELAELKAFKEETTKRFAPARTNIPDWFKELYGENEVAWQKYSEREVVREQEIEQRLLDRQYQAEQQKVAESQHWNRWVESEFTKLQAEGATFDRNKFASYMLKYKPTDDAGNLDFKAGYELYQLKEGGDTAEKSDARKQLADTTTRSTSRGEKPRKEFMTPADLRNTSWNNIA